MPRGTHDALPDERNETVLVYVNGELIPRAQAAVSVLDSGFLIGDGVWEGLRLHEGGFAHLAQHLARLEQGARATALELGMTREEITAALYRTVQANGMHSDVHVRLMFTRGVKKTPSQDPRLTIGGPTVVIIAEHKRANPEHQSGGITLFTSTVRRPPPDTLDQRLNCHSKLHEVIALQQALAAGADEALMLDTRGFVATCNATNFFIVRGGAVWTSGGRHCLPGITRGEVLRICREEGIPAWEGDFSLTDVYDAEEAFVTGTFGGLTPVREIDGRKIGEGDWPMTRHLSARYRAEMAASARAAAAAKEAG
ncbi:MAG: aminotransferase class IV [Chloroflexi bacterium]|nr:aminotransferase class IV [Chloroflexota bacterium]